MLLERIEALKQQINALTADNQEKIEALRIKYLIIGCEGVEN